MLQNQQRPSQPSSPTGTKWVTFNDMVDDAMEGGKLRNNYNLNRRRASMMDTPTSSGQIMTGSCSTQDFTQALKSQPWYSSTDSGFGNSQPRNNDEFSTTTELQSQTELPSRNPFYHHHANPENTTPSEQCNNSADFRQTPVLPKPPETQGRTRRAPRLSTLSAVTRHSVSSMSTSGTYDDEEDSDDRGSVGSGGDRPFSQSFGGIGEKDKYSVFTGLKKPGQGYTGWSTTVMGTGPFGWSDELLNGGEDTTTAAATGQEDQEKPWYKGHRPATWNRSPTRSYLRNFP